MQLNFITKIQKIHDKTNVFNNYSSSPNGLWVSFSKIQLTGQKYRDKITLASKTRFSDHCFGFQIRRFSLLVGYNI